MCRVLHMLSLVVALITTRSIRSGTGLACCRSRPGKLLNRRVPHAKSCKCRVVRIYPDSSPSSQTFKNKILCVGRERGTADASTDVNPPGRLGSIAPTRGCLPIPIGARQPACVSGSAIGCLNTTRGAERTRNSALPTQAHSLHAAVSSRAAPSADTGKEEDSARERAIATTGTRPTSTQSDRPARGSCCLL